MKVGHCGSDSLRCHLMRRECTAMKNETDSYSKCISACRNGDGLKNGKKDTESTHASIQTRYTISPSSYSFLFSVCFNTAPSSPDAGNAQKTFPLCPSKQSSPTETD